MFDNFLFQIPLDDVTRKECKYALIDCKTAEDAEMLWKKLDGAKINGGTMRISFSSPGRLAATLLGGQEPQLPVRTVICIDFSFSMCFCRVDDSSCVLSFH